MMFQVWILWREGRALELMDTCLRDCFDESQALRCIQVGLLCVQTHSEDRPAMSSVVFMLSNEGVALPQPKQPDFFAERGSGTDAALCIKEHHTENQPYITELDPR